MRSNQRLLFMQFRKLNGEDMGLYGSGVNRLMKVSRTQSNRQLQEQLCSVCYSSLLRMAFLAAFRSSSMVQELAASGRVTRTMLSSYFISPFGCAFWFCGCLGLFDWPSTFKPFLPLNGTGWAFRKLSMSKSFSRFPLAGRSAYSSRAFSESECSEDSSLRLGISSCWLRWRECSRNSLLEPERRGGGFSREYSSLVEGDTPKSYLLSRSPGRLEESPFLLREWCWWRQESRQSTLLALLISCTRCSWARWWAESEWSWEEGAESYSSEYSRLLQSWMKTVLSCRDMLSSFSSVILRFITRNDNNIPARTRNSTPLISPAMKRSRVLSFPRGKMNLRFLIINIFISSNMLELLELADAGRTRPKDRESPVKEERFNVLLARLRERNLHNQDFIRRFRQKAARKRVKFPEIAARIARPTQEAADDHEDEEPRVALPFKRTLPACEKAKQLSQKTMWKEDPLKETNHTLTEDVSSEDEKTLSFPNLDFCPAETGGGRPKQQFQNLKQDKEFNKYLRNVFFKEVSSKIERNYAGQGQGKEEPRRSMGRMKTEMASSKYKLNIKSLIFGNTEGSEGKSQQKIELPEKPRRAEGTEKLKSLERYERDAQFQDDRLSSKGLLPTIHNHQVTKNKRFLENYIKYNNQDRTQPQPAEIRTISLANDPEIGRKDATPSRAGLSLRIQTITIQKSP